MELGWPPTSSLPSLSRRRSLEVGGHSLVSAISLRKQVWTASFRIGSRIRNGRADRFWRRRAAFTRGRRPKENIQLILVLATAPRRMLFHVPGARAASSAASTMAINARLGRPKPPPARFAQRWNVAGQGCPPRTAMMTISADLISSSAWAANSGAVATSMRQMRSSGVKSLPSSRARWDYAAIARPADVKWSVRIDDIEFFSAALKPDDMTGISIDGDRTTGTAGSLRWKSECRR